MLSVFHIVWAWNDFFGALIDLTNEPELQPLSGRKIKEKT
jgi:ABC-type glycerol-3-phosphate transport system permease component